jgi:AAA domain
MTKNLRQELSPDCVDAHYSEQRLPQYKGNPLIEALPKTLSDEELYDVLSQRPAFEPEQRDWSAQERIQMLETLQSFMLPLSMHFRLARSLDAMLRAGYVGRAPRTAEHNKKFQLIYENQKKGVPFRQTSTSQAAQISALLMGLSGMGKTTSVKRWFAHIPQVIYHPGLDIYQVTYLHVEMPSDGSSIKGLAHGILQALDRLIPNANYYETFTKGKPGADTLMRSVARVLNMHFVGFLIGDEIQNLTNAKKGGQTVMTELVSACNDLGLPMLFIGTNKAAKVFSLDFRQSRRATGHGIPPWDRFPASVEPGEVDEWREFVSVLWSYQWVQNAVELDELLLNTMYQYSQGVIDIAIKLFATAQARAIVDGSEVITLELLTDVYNTELKLLHPMIEALRDDDLERLALFDDIAPVGLSEILADMDRKLKGKASKAFTVKPADPTFVPRIVSSLVSSGFGQDEAEQAALGVVSAGKVTNLLQGTKAAMAALTAHRAVPKSKGKDKTAETSVQARTIDDPNDYLNALDAARQGNTTVREQLRTLGMARPVDELFELD